MEVNIGNLRDEVSRLEGSALGEYLAEKHRKQKEDIADTLVRTALNSTDSAVRFVAQQLVAANTWDEVLMLKDGQVDVPSVTPPETVRQAFEPYYTP